MHTHQNSQDEIAADREQPAEVVAQIDAPVATPDPETAGSPRGVSPVIDIPAQIDPPVATPAPQTPITAKDIEIPTGPEGDSAMPQFPDYDPTTPALNGSTDMQEAIGQVYKRHAEVTGMDLATNFNIESVIRACIEDKGLPMVLAYMDWIDSPAAGLPWYDSRGMREPNFDNIVTLKSLFKDVDRFRVDRAPRVQKWLSQGRETPIVKTKEQLRQEEIDAAFQKQYADLLSRDKKAEPRDVTPDRQPRRIAS